MPFCTNCGSQIQDGTKFCPCCGQKQAMNEPVAASAAPAQEMPVQPAQPSQPEQAETPTQGSYQTVCTPSAAQQSYTPPVQQTTGQQSYQAPQQSYSAQPAYVANAPKQKKPLNKKRLFILGGAVLAVILAVVLIAVLGGKGDKAVSSDPNLGIYNAVSAEMWGIEMTVTDFWEKGFTIELKDNGKCAMEIDGTKANGKWTLNGSDFHVEGGGLDCDGTLANGAIKLENVLGMGITLNLAKEGGTAAQTGGNTAVGGSGSISEATDLQKQWNGTWYGCMYVSEATGAFAGIPSDFYDAYMVVDVDSEGKGQFAVFLDGVDEAFALANCEAKESGLYAIDGTVAGGEEMYAYNWMFLPMPDYPDQYVMGDIIENGDNIFDFKLFMKQWGGSWQKEIDSDFAITPPSVEWYNEAIERGEIPPVGFAPIGYEGTSASSGAQGESTGSDSLEPGELPDDQLEPQPTTDGEYGMSEAGADGIVSLDALIAAVKYCDEHRSEVTYEDVYSRMGNVHGVAQVDRDIWKPGEVHSYCWTVASGEYCYINFDVADNGSEYWKSMSYTMGLID